MWDGISGAFRSAINVIIDGWNSLQFSIPEVDLGPLGTLGGFTLGTPNIPRLQTGGILTEPGLFMGHSNEAVIPLNSTGVDVLAAAMREAQAQGDGIGGNISVIVRIGERDITDMIDTEIMRNNKTLTRQIRAGSGRI